MVNVTDHQICKLLKTSFKPYSYIVVLSVYPCM